MYLISRLFIASIVLLLCEAVEEGDDTHHFLVSHCLMTGNGKFLGVDLFRKQQFRADINKGTC